MAKEYRSRPTIQSLGRGLKLLDHVASAGKAVELGELAEVIGIEKSSTHRLMATLIASGFVFQDAQKRYLAGSAIVELASKIGSRDQIYDIAGPYLNELSEKTGETAHLGVLGRGQAILINCVASNHTLAVTSRVGAGEPLHCTALGKALICDSDKDEIKKLLDGQRLRKYAGKTIGTVSLLAEECLRIKETMVAVDDEEFREGIRCAAAPVRNYSGNIVAAIGTSGPKSRLNDKRFKEVELTVKEVGLKISKRLGYTLKDI